jgi:hypothetical protein
MDTAYDYVRGIALANDRPTVVVPVVDAGEPMLWFASFDGPPDWLELCRRNPALAAIACCLSAIDSSRKAGYLPALP